MNQIQAKTWLSVVVLTGVLLVTVGCTTAERQRLNMSPELRTMAQTQQTRWNRIARSVDTDSRQFWDDLDRVLLLDRPVITSRFPIP